MFSCAVKLLEGERVRPLVICLSCESDGVDSKLTLDETGCARTDLRVETNDSSALKRTKIERVIFGKGCDADCNSSRVSLRAFYNNFVVT